MSEFVLVTDSSADLSEEMAQAIRVPVLPLRFTIQGQTYRNYPDNREMDPALFYDMLRAGELATTAALNPNDFEEELEPYLKDGKDILILAFSSGLSTTFNSSRLAVEELQEKYPQRKIYTVDTLCASMGQGLLVDLAVQEKRKGKTIDQVHVFAEETKAKVCHWFTVDDLNHLKRGGRVSAAAALFGTMLSIKPVLHVDDTGHLVPVSKTRGRKASLLALVDRMAESAIDPAGQTIFISHGDCEADAEFVADEVRRRFGVQDIYINYVGPVIGNHSGPGTLALFFLGSRR